MVPNTHSVQGKYSRVRIQSKEEQHRTAKNEASPTALQLIRDPGKRETWGVRESEREPEKEPEREPGGVNEGLGRTFFQQQKLYRTPRQRRGDRLVDVGWVSDSSSQISQCLTAEVGTVFESELGPCPRTCVTTCGLCVNVCLTVCACVSGVGGGGHICRAFHKQNDGITCLSYCSSAVATLQHALCIPPRDPSALIVSVSL